jgi:hypothetical protein
MSLAAAQAQFVAAAVVIEPDMFLKQRTMLAIRICVEQQVQGYLVFKQGTPFARKDIEMFRRSRSRSCRPSRKPAPSA